MTGFDRKMTIVKERVPFTKEYLKERRTNKMSKKGAPTARGKKGDEQVPSGEH